MGSNGHGSTQANGGSRMSDNRVEVIYMGLSECSTQFCLQIEGEPNLREFDNYEC